MIRRIFFDFVVYFCCLSAALACAALLFYDVYISKNVHSGLDRAGYLGDKIENVRRQTVDSMLWDDLDRSEDVYWNDAIQSGPSSQATVDLKNGIVLRMAESSLI